MRLFAALLLTAASIAAQAHYPGPSAGAGNGNATQIQGRAVDSSAPSDKNVMCWTQSATHWGPCASQSTAPGGTNTAIQFNHPNGTLAGNAAIAAEQPTSLGTPAAPTVTPTCSGTCATTWGYQLYAVNAVGASIGSVETTALNAATLDSTHKNTITAVAIPGATTIMVFRLTSPSTFGIIGSIAATGGNLVDTGLVGDSNTSPPNVDGTQGVFFSQNATFGYPFVNMLPPTSGVLLNNTPLNLYQSGGATSLNFWSDNTAFPSTGPVLPSTDTDYLGQITFSGYSGGYFGAATILAAIEGTPTQGTVPGQLIFRTFDAGGRHDTTQHADGTFDLSSLPEVKVPAPVNGVDATTKTYVDAGLSGKQATLGFTAENSANKDTDGTLAANSDTRYASQKATKAYADTKAASNASTTVNGQTCPLGSSCTISTGSSITSNSFANLPGTCTHTSTASDAYWTTDSYYNLICTATNTWSAWAFSYPATIPPTTSWTWDNQASSTVDFTSGYMHIATPASSSLSLSLQYRAIPVVNGNPYSIVATISADLNISTNQGLSVGFRDNTGKLIEMLILMPNGSPQFQVDNWTTSTNNSSLGSSILGAGSTIRVGSQNPISLCWTDDGTTNLSWYYSMDRKTWTLITTKGRTSFTAAPTANFIGAYSNAGAVDLKVISWSTTTTSNCT